MKLSIAIPVYEMNQVGGFFLRKNLENINNQTFRDFEVVITDHSKDDTNEKIINDFNGKININYIRNKINYGNSSSNLNLAIRNCRGEYIKILMQDEFLYGNDSLFKLVNFINENNKPNWVLTGCVFGSDLDTIRGNILPYYREEIILGVNSIGSPSVLTIKNENRLLFDENLIWLMDCDYYKRLYDKFGSPSIINDYLIFVTQHKNQLTNLIHNKIKQNEHKLLLNYKKNGTYL